MNKISSLYSFLKKNNLGEYRMLASLAEQEDLALDPKPFRIRRDSLGDIDVPKEYIEKGEGDSCEMINFGIKALQKERVVANLKKNKVFLPENVRFIHFDLQKLMECLKGSSFSEKGYEMLSALSASESTKSISIESFMSKLKDFPGIKEAFESVINPSAINYILIGTSDASVNFVGTEKGAQHFHMTTINHVFHDLGHSSYDRRREDREADKFSGVGGRASLFPPIGIFSEYVFEMMMEFEKIKGSLTGSVKDLKGISDKGIERVRKYLRKGVPLNFDFAVAETLRDSRIAYDFRSFVGTGSGGKPIGFTDKLDFDQDLFAYIMMAESEEGIRKRFSNPKMPKQIEIFFEKYEEMLPEGARESFEKTIKDKHSEAVEKMIEYMKSTLKGDDETISSGIMTDMMENFSGGSADNPGKVIVFNMLDIGVHTLKSEDNKNLSEKGYVDPKDTYIVSKDSERKTRKTRTDANPSEALSTASLSLSGHLHSLNGKEFEKPVRSNFRIALLRCRLKIKNTKVLSVGDRFSISSGDLSLSRDDIAGTNAGSEGKGLAEMFNSSFSKGEDNTFYLNRDRFDFTPEDSWMGEEKTECYYIAIKPMFKTDDFSQEEIFITRVKDRVIEEDPKPITEEEEDSSD